MKNNRSTSAHLHNPMRKTNGDLSIFLVEDDPMYATVLKQELKSSSYENVWVFPSGESFIKNMYFQPDIVLLDYYLDGKLNGLDVLKEIKTHNESFNENIEVIFLSGQEKIRTALDAVKSGAFDYVVKGESALNETKNLIRKIIKKKEIIKERKLYREGIALFAIILFSFVGILLYLTNYVF